jgi:NAD(P)-dependent dehydrogenase (short-subunit alcohol dehydrogenase family)
MELGKERRGGTVRPNDRSSTIGALTSYEEQQMATYDLKGKRVMITGASSGIGWALAKRFAKEGAQLALLARRIERLERLAEEIEVGGASKPLAVRTDLSGRGNAVKAAEQVDEELGGVDVLVNNAGGAVGGSLWAVADRDEARADFEVDFWSPLALIGAFVPGMRQRGHGTVVNVTSIRQVIAWPSFGQNSAAQAALALATETLRLELLRYGVHVVEVIPGPIETPVQGPTSLMPGITEAFHDRLGTASPEEISELIVEAVKRQADRVFCPDETTRRVYEEPVAARAEILKDVERIYGALPPNDMIDSLVIGADHPMILEAREQWEKEHQTEPEVA